MRYYIERHSSKIKRFLFLAVLLIGVGIVAKLLIASKQDVVKNKELGSSSNDPNTPVLVSTRVLATGNFGWGGAISSRSGGVTSYPFSTLAEFSRNQYEAWMTNLYCAPDEVGENNCQTSFVEEMSSWFNIVALGNSSSGSSSASSPLRQALSNFGIQYIGSKDPAASNICAPMTLPARFTMGDTSFKVAKMPLALCSIYVNEANLRADQIDNIRAYSALMPTWVYVFNNPSNGLTTTASQSSKYQSVIDAGADMVLGNDPISVQGAENYRGKLIIYSMGNLTYQGSSVDEEIKRGIMLSITASSAIDQNVLEWSNFVNQCSLEKDNCINVSRGKGLSKHSYKYDIELIPVSIDSNGLPVEADKTWSQLAPERLGWADLIETLDYTK